MRGEAEDCDCDVSPFPGGLNSNDLLDVFQGIDDDDNWFSENASGSADGNATLEAEAASAQVPQLPPASGTHYSDPQAPKSSKEAADVSNALDRALAPYLPQPDLGAELDA